jgi:glycosyltransferase 2 family protein
MAADRLRRQEDVLADDEKVKPDIQDDNAQNVFRLRASFKAVLRYLAAFGLLTALFYLGLIDLRPLATLWDRPWILAGLVAFAWLTLPLLVWRWWLLLRGVGIHVRYLDAFSLFYFSSFVGMLLPGSVGGDITRILLGNKNTPDGIWRYSCSVVADRVFGIFGLLGIGLLACVAYYREILNDGLLRYGVGLAIAAFFFGVVFLLLLGLAAPRLLRYLADGRVGGKIGKMLTETVAALADYAGNRRVLWVALMISLSAQAKDLILLRLLDMVMGVGALDLAGHAVAGTMTFLINTLPLTPQGLGIGEIAYSRLAGILANGASVAGYAALLLAFRLVMLLTVLPAPFLMPRSGRVLASEV